MDLLECRLGCTRHLPIYAWAHGIYTLENVSEKCLYDEAGSELGVSYTLTPWPRETPP